MTAAESLDIVTPPASLRDVPWTWRHLVIGCAPVVVADAAAYLLNPSILAHAPRWAWIVFAALQLAWFAAFPFCVARRLPRLPRARTLLIEGGIALLVAPLAVLMLSVLTQILTGLLGSGHSSGPFDAIAEAPDRYHFPALIVLAVAVAPIAEEFFFRGMLFNFLRRRMHFVLASLVCGAIFGLAHPFCLAERLGIASVGVGLALLYEWRKTLVTPVLVHALTNALGMTALYAMTLAAANAPVLGVRGDARDAGCVVTEVTPGGAAEAAGIRAGDVITAAGENSVRGFRDLILIMRTKKVGETIPVWYTRDGQTFQTRATLRARPK